MSWAGEETYALEELAPPSSHIIEGPIDFNDILVENPAAPLADPAVLFAVRIAGDSIKTIAIYPNEIVVANKARQLRNGNILLALLDTLFAMKRYCITQDGIRLEVANPNYPDMTITEANDFELWASSPIPFGRC